MAMTKDEFRARWLSDDKGGGITWDEIAECAIAWRVCTRPRIQKPDVVRYNVLVAAMCVDAEDFRPSDRDALEMGNTEYDYGHGIKHEERL